MVDFFRGLSFALLVHHTHIIFFDPESNTLKTSITQNPSLLTLLQSASPIYFLVIFAQSRNNLYICKIVWHSFKKGVLMRILVACEESQVVTTAFRDKGHEAYSCDIIPQSGSHPEWHIQVDVLQLLKMKWDVILAFPPCTHIASSGARWFEQKRKSGVQQQAINFFMEFTKTDCHKVAIENPIGIMSTIYRKPDQIIQPWQFGHGETKSTCLWLKGLPLLSPTKIVSGREQRIWKLPPSEDRSKLRSKTYAGIALAMASQWG
jgi:hypothetical protein